MFITNITKDILCVLITLNKTYVHVNFSLRKLTATDVSI